MRKGWFSRYQQLLTILQTFWSDGQISMMLVHKISEVNSIWMYIRLCLTSGVLDTVLDALKYIKYIKWALP